MSVEDHRRFMREALALADEAAVHGEVPVGALVVRGSEVLGRGYNLRESTQDPTTHAEIVAIREAARAVGSWRLEGCRLYVTLEPCPMCAGAMVLARVDQCIFGCSDPKGGFLGTLADLSRWPGLNHHYDVVGGVLEEECAERLRTFFRGLRARKS
jgi:tRNA(adenine34) deaminase